MNTKTVQNRRITAIKSFKNIAIKEVLVTSINQFLASEPNWFLLGVPIAGTGADAGSWVGFVVQYDSEIVNVKPGELRRMLDYQAAHSVAADHVAFCDYVNSQIAIGYQPFDTVYVNPASADYELVMFHFDSLTSL